MIRHAEISKMAHRLGLSEKTIEKDYILTWVLNAIASAPLKRLLALKGGTAIKKMYVPDYRFSEDLDFTLVEPVLSMQEVLEQVKQLIPWVSEKVNLQLDVERIEEHKTGNFAIYLNYSGPLQAQLDKRALKVDFSGDETLIFPLRPLPVQSPYSDCVRENSLINVYCIEEIMIEKLRSLLSRSEPRDLFDVHYLLSNQMADVELISYKCAQKFSDKNLEMSDLHDVLDRKQKEFRQYWHARLDGQMPAIPEFDEIVRETKKYLKKYF